MRTTKIRKILLKVVLSALCVLTAGCLLSACAMTGQTGGISSSTGPHTHEFVKMSARKATCIKEGRVAYWYCEDCGKYFLDAKATKEIKLEDTVIAKIPHTVTKTEEIPSTCTKRGQEAFWTCSACTRIFSDEACTTQVEMSDLTIAKAAHTLQHVEGKPIENGGNGLKEHWTCDVCHNYFADANGKKRMDEEDTILYSLMNIPDFVVEVPMGRDPIVLQLSDTQIIDATQRPDREGVDHNYYATENRKELCYDYLTEIITATNPDLIILTGDLIYGEFDVDGSAWTYFINFMDSFGIYWAPIFGNHDNESPMGVDWQCAQLETMEYCLFEQKELTGNGNYSVGIAQGEELTRVFYMMDSNGCSNPSAATEASTHFQREFGFAQDQIDWYTKQIEILKSISPETKISFAYHAQTAAFVEAYEKYGYMVGDESQSINVDTLSNKAETDFGYIGKGWAGDWDKRNIVYEGLKELGVDSIFVGHEHCNSASVVYEGIRFQFGQKSSQYDYYNIVNAEGVVKGVFGRPEDGFTPLIGGSVMILSEEDGSIKDAYIYYCENAGGHINWDDFVQGGANN